MDQKHSKSGCTPTLLTVLVGIIFAAFFALGAKAEMAFSTVEGKDGVPLVVAEAGNRDGPSIVFIHGYSQDLGAWTHQMQDAELTKRFRLIAFDLRGHGASAKPWDAQSYQTQDWADDLAQIIAAKALDKPVLVGWSYGGTVIAAYAQVYGTENLGGIVFVASAMSFFDMSELSAALETQTPLEKPDTSAEPRRDTMTSDDTRANIKGTKGFVALLTAKPMDKMAQDQALYRNLMTPAYARRHILANLSSFETVRPDLDIPVVFIQGAEDAIIPLVFSELNQSKFPNAELLVYPNVGHSPFLESPTRFNADIAAFMERRPK